MVGSTAGDPGAAPTPSSRVTIGAPSNRSKFTQQSAVRQRARLIAATVVAVLVIAVIALVAWYLNTRNNQAASLRNSRSYVTTSVPLAELRSQELALDKASQLSINGQLRINNSFVLTPTDTPANPLLGQFYLNSQNRDLYYYNGTTFVNLATGDDLTTINNTINGLGSVSKTTPGTGLAISGGKLNNTGVLSLQGTANQINLSASTGNITVSLPQDIAPGSSPTFAGVQVGSLTARPSDSGLNIGSATQDLTLQGANTSIKSSANGFTTTLAFANPSSNNTLIVPDIGGTICTTVGNCGGGASVSLQPTSPGTAQTGNANLTGTIIAGQFQGDGSGVTNVNAALLNGQAGSFYQNASNINTGTLADARLSGNVTLKGNSFNGANELVLLDGSGVLPALSGVNLTNLNATNIASGTLNNNRLSASVTLQGNTFNGANQLVQLDGSGVLPALSGINLTNLNANNIASGTLAVARGGTGAGDATNARINLGAAASGANTDITSLAPASTLTIGSNGQQLVLQGSITTIHDTDNGNTTSLNFTTPTGNNTITIPDASGYICLSNGNCLGGGGGGANTSLSNLSGVALNVDIQPAANGQTSLGNSSKGFANLYVADSTNNFTFRFTGNALTANKNITLPSFTGSSAELCLSTGNCAGSGSSVTTTPGTIGTIPVYTGTQQIGNSIITQDVGATTVTIGGALTVNNQLNANGGIVTNNANINAGSGTITGNGSGLTNLNGSNITTGTVADGRLSGNVTLQGNTFNGNSQLVQTTAGGLLPVISGQNLTNLNASNLTSGTVSDNRLSANVALLNGTNVFSGTNNFKPGSNSASAFRIQNAAGSLTLFNADTTGSGALTFGVPSNFSSTVAVGVLGFINGDTPVCRNISNQLSSCNANAAGVTLQQAYNASTSPQLVLTSAKGGLVVQDASSPIGGNLLAVQSNGGGTTYLAVTATGASITGTLAVSGTYNTNTFNSNTLTFGAASAASISSASGQALTVDSGTTGDLNLGTSANAKAIAIGNSQTGTTVTTTAGLTTATINNTGETVKGSNATQSTGASGSTAAFQIQSAAGSNLFQVDSANNNIVLGGNNSGALQSWATNATPLLGCSTPCSNGLNSATSVIYGGYVYWVGGLNNLSQAQSTVWSAPLNSNGSVGTWTQSANQLQNVRALHSSVVVNGYLYVFGGQDAATANNSAYYAPLGANGAVGSWSAAQTLGTTRSSTAAVTANGYVYVIGGYDNSNNIKNTVLYSPAGANGTLGSWTTNAQNLPGAVYGATSVVANGYVYVIGGNNPSTVSTVYYAKLNSDGSTGAWSTNTNALPTALAYSTSVVSNGYVYVMGGNNAGQVNTVYYAKLNSDGSVGTWSTANTLPQVLSSGTSVVANGYVYYLGGSNGSANSPNIYYASTQRIQVGGSLDLVGLAGQTLANPGGGLGTGSTGGSITAGDAIFVGNLQVQGQSTFGQGINVGNTAIDSIGNISVAGTYNSNTFTSNSLTFGGNNVTIKSANTKDLTVTSGTSGALNLDSGTTGNVNLGTGSNSKAIQIGPSNVLGINTTINVGTNSGGASTTTLTLGSGSGTSGTTLQAGTNGVKVSAAASATAFQVIWGAGPTLSVDTSGASPVIKVQGATANYATFTIYDSHFKSFQTNAPTIGTPSNCGASPTAAFQNSPANSTDSAGSFRISASTGSPTTCDTVISFSQAYGRVPKSIIVVPESADGGTGTAAARQIYVSASSTTTFTVKMNSAPAASEVNWFYYWVVE